MRSGPLRSKASSAVTWLQPLPDSLLDQIGAARKIGGAH